MIEPTDEMVQAFSRVFFRNPLGEDVRGALAAAFAILERDYRIEPKPPWEKVVHLATRGDWHLHCCGMDIGEIDDADRITLDPHGVTCKGPS